MALRHALVQSSMNLLLVPNSASAAPMNQMNAPVSQLPLGQSLLARGVISEDQLKIALVEQRKFKSPLGKILVQLGFVTEATIRDTLSESLGQVAIDLSNTIIDHNALALVPKDIARRYQVLPVDYDKQSKKLLLAGAHAPKGGAVGQERGLSMDEGRRDQGLAGEIPSSLA